MSQEVAASAALPSRMRRLLSEPTIPILLVASIAMFQRRYVPDILLVLGTTVLIVVDSARWGFRETSARPEAHATHRVRNAGALLAVAAATATLPRTSNALDLACAVPGGVALWVAWQPGEARARDQTPRVPTRWWIWPALGVGLALVELYSFLYRKGPLTDDPHHPELSTLVEPGLDNLVVRALFLWVWLLIGWWLLRRVRAWGR